MVDANVKGVHDQVIDESSFTKYRNRSQFMLLASSISNTLGVVCECTDHRRSSQSNSPLTIKVVMSRLLGGSSGTAQA